MLGFLHPLKLTRDSLKAVVGSPTDSDTLQILTDGSQPANTKWSQTPWEYLTAQWITNSTFTKWKQAEALSKGDLPSDGMAAVSLSILIRFTGRRKRVFNDQIQSGKTSSTEQGSVFEMS